MILERLGSMSYVAERERNMNDFKFILSVYFEFFIYQTFMSDNAID